MSKVKQAIGITLFESDNFGGPKIVGGGICPTQRAEKVCYGVIEVTEMEIKLLGNLFGDDKGTGFAGNVWDKDHLSPTLNTMQGGCKQPMILESVNELGFMDNGTGKHQSNTVYDEKSLCPNITTIDGGGTQQIKIATDVINKVGQISNDGSQYGTVIADNGLSPNLVAGTHGYANSCIATQYRIRKLTPRECWRLMDFSDEDFEKAAEVNSNTQLYKQAGNSIVVNVLAAILGQLLPGKENVYKELSE